MLQIEKGVGNVLSLGCGFVFVLFCGKLKQHFLFPSEWREVEKFVWLSFGKATRVRGEWVKG